LSGGSGCFLLIPGFYPMAPGGAAEIAGVFPLEKTALYVSLVSEASFFRRHSEILNE